MRKIETEVSRANLAKRFAALQKQASEDPKRIDSMTDSFDGKEDISGLIEKIMRAMDAQDGVGKYHAKKAALKAATAALLVEAMEELETPEEEAHDLANPVMHQLEDAEQVVDTLHQPRLEDEIEQLEHDTKEQLNHSGDAMENKFASLQAKIAKEEAKVSAMKRVAALLESPRMEREEKAQLLEAFASLLKSASEDEADKKEEKSEDTPAFFQSDEPGDEEIHEEKKEASADLTKIEKQALLNARLAFLKRQANVDGKSMATPKEVPTAEGTTEDNLKGDAKIQYQTAVPEDAALDEIVTKRQKVQRSVGGAGEANEIYFGNDVESHYEVQHSSDSAKAVNNKRSLKDMGTAVQPDHPVSPRDEQEAGAGTHQKELQWESEKEKANQTPGGPRLKGLAELIKERTDRGFRLASMMHAKGMIKTEDDYRNRLVEFASMDDDKFGQIEDFVKSTPDKEEDRKDEREDKDEEKREASVSQRSGLRRVASATPDFEDETEAIIAQQRMPRSASAASTGLSRPLHFGVKEAATSPSGDLRDALSSIGWDSPITRLASLSASELDSEIRNPDAYLRAEASRSGEGLSSRRIG